jgi:hypothetical protein
MTNLIERTLRGLSNQLGNRVSRPGDDGYVAVTEISAKPIGCIRRALPDAARRPVRNCGRSFRWFVAVAAWRGARLGRSLPVRWPGD